MMQFWISMSGREKSSLVAAGLISVLVLGQIFIVRPIWFESADISGDLIRQNEVVDELAIMPRAMTDTASAEASTTTNIDGLRGVLLASASNSGLAVNRVQANNTGITLYFDRTLPELFFVWIRAVEADEGLKPEKFTIRRVGGTEVRASVEFVRG